MRWIGFLFVLGSFTTSAQNLLVNAGFEEENICTEYKINCAPEGWIYTVPSFIYYFRDQNLAHTGSRFIALVAGHAKKPFYRTFARSRLLCGLRKGNTYQLQFFIKSRHQILDSVGIYFSSYDFLFEKRPYRKIVPAIYVADALEKPASDSNWQQITINYTASGEESFITFGNFKTQDLTGPTGIDRENNYFFLLDDVSLKPLNPDEKLCGNADQTLEEIYVQDERHEYLDRLIKYKRKLPLEPVRLIPTIQQKIDTVIMPDILFVTGNSSLPAASFVFLDSISDIISSKVIDSVVVEGHTDSIGTFEINQKLGKDRADAVVSYFQKKNGNTNYISRGWADKKPAVENRTPEGRQRNRRVEIYLYLRE